MESQKEGRDACISKIEFRALNDAFAKVMKMGRQKIDLVTPSRILNHFFIVGTLMPTSPDISDMLIICDVLAAQRRRKRSIVLRSPRLTI